MRKMEEKILKEGQILPGNILKVGSFLNQQIDVAFLKEMAAEIAQAFAGEIIDKVLTIEASGIAFATMIAAELGARVVVVKKHASANISGEVYSADIYSYTHSNSYKAVVSKDYLKAGERILLADDFLAVGNAINGLMDILKQAGAELVGCAIAVEKGFQKGGDTLRAQGIHVESLAIVDSMSDTEVVFRS